MLEDRTLPAASIESLVVPPNGTTGQTVSFSAQASSDQPGASLYYYWNFGDGTPTVEGLNLTNPTHAYQTPTPANAPDTVTLTVYDGTQNDATASAPISLAAPPINIAPVPTATAGNPVTFSAATVYPGESAAFSSIQWDFTYNGTFTADPSANNNFNPTFTYTTAGTYTVEAQAVDLGGNSSTATATVQVQASGGGLMVSAGPGQTAIVGQPLTLQGSYTDPNGTVSPSGIAWDTNYNGSTFTPTVTGTLTPSVTYASAGTYYAALQITDSNNVTAMGVETITVQPSQGGSGPTADAGSNQTILEGGTASFAGSYTDTSGTVSPSGIAWDFQYNGQTFNPMTTGTLTPTYQYSAPGVYTVALQVMDSNGRSSLSTLQLTVTNVPPTVNAGPDQTVNEGANAQFSGSATDPGGPGDIVSEDWDFDYNGTFVADASAHNMLTPTHVFTSPGNYVVALEATDASGATGLDTLTVTVQGVAINSLVVPGAANEGDTVSFSAQASTTLSGASLTYNWNFGDGGTASGVDLTDPTHVYAAPATAGTPYTVTLSVSDGTTSASGSGNITVTNVAPSVNAGPSQTIYAGTTAQFNATITDPGGSSDITSIQWDFNNNGTTFNADPSASGLTNPTYSYASAGTYVVAVQATDQSGTTTTDYTTVTVKPPDALLVSAGPALTVTAGQPVTLQGGYTDPGGTVSSSGIAWDTQYDGSTFNADVTGNLTPSVTYVTAGTYYTALQVTDSTGASDIAVTEITVNPVSYVGPMATAGSDQTINAGATASFSGSYTDPDGTVSSSGIAWDFNYDGSTFNSMTTGTLTPTYQYGTPGTYTAALQITDSNGLVSLSTLTVTVNSVAPTVTVQGPSVVTAGQAVTYTGTASLPSGDQDTLSTAWDFNYQPGNFIPSSATGLTPQTVFATPGTYVVAFQASDAEGDTSLATETVTVNSSSSLVVNAGPDQAIGEGDTTTFAGSWMDGPGTVNTSTAQWDFNYDGTTFVADPSANGTLTPSYQFTTPGTYLVALQLTDSNNITSLGELYVSVANIAPTVDAGPDQTVNVGATALFNGTVSDPGGSADIVSEDWDFDYDGNTFVADPSAHNTLTPSDVFTTAGTYEVALQATDADGASTVSTLIVTVSDVAPSATVSNSGPAVEGSPVTFTVSNVVDANAGDTPSYAADWTGSGTFQELTSDDLTTNPNGSVSFSHIYDVAGNYSPVIEVLDGYGDSTSYTQTVTITPAPLTASFGPSGGSTAVTSTTPFLFTNVTDPSVTETQAGFTYFVSVDGGVYTSSTSASSLLPSGLALGNHTVSGYVENAEGVTSPVYTTTVNLQNPQVIVTNSGTGILQLSWTGGSSGDVQPNSSYTITGPANNLMVTLETDQATYDITTNGTLATVSAAQGVQNVTLTLDTLDPIAGMPSVGDGSIGEIDPPAGSTLNVYDRGNLGSIVGATGLGSHTGITAEDLEFMNLTGKIINVDVIDQLAASGWLGTLASQLVQANAGIASLSAYGIGATVQADLRQDAGDPALAVAVGDGGIPGLIGANRLGPVQAHGAVNMIDATFQEGDFSDIGPGRTTFLALGGAGAAPGGGGATPSLTSDDDVVETITGNASYSKIAVKGSLKLTVDGGSLAVTNDIIVGDVTKLDVGKDLTARNLQVTTGGIGQQGLDVGGNLKLTGKLEAAAGIWDLEVGLSAQATQIVADTGNIQFIGVGNDPTAGANSDLITSLKATKGDVLSVSVARDFLLPAGAKASDFLVFAGGNIGDITVGRTIGKPAPGDKPFGVIQGASIALVKSTTGSVGVSVISTSGDIGEVNAASKNIYGNIRATGGNVGVVQGLALYGSVEATRDKTLVTGNIGSVLVADLLSSRIVADTAIGTIAVVDPDANVTTTIQAQCGGVVLPLAEFVGGELVQVPTLVVQPLKLQVFNNKQFRGTLTFTYGAAPIAERVAIPANSVLVQYQYGNSRTPTTYQWTVKRTAGTDPSVYLKNAVFRFDTDFGIQTDPTMATFTKLNTAATTTTDFSIQVPKK